MKVVWDFGGRRGSSTCLGVCVSVCVSGFWEEAEPLPPLPHSLWLRPVGRNRAWLHRRHQTPWETVYLWVTVNKPDTTRCDCNICKQKCYSTAVSSTSRSLIKPLKHKGSLYTDIRWTDLTLRQPADRLWTLALLQQRDQHHRSYLMETWRKRAGQVRQFTGHRTSWSDFNKLEQPETDPDQQLTLFSFRAWHLKS